eukprot:COSAG02_NODE_5353_length_4404_cov_3.974216_4_plen_100_part_00
MHACARERRETVLYLVHAAPAWCSAPTRTRRTRTAVTIDMVSVGGIPPRVTHDPNSGLLRPNRVKRLLAAGGTAFIAAGELNWTGDRSAVQDTQSPFTL